MYDVSGDDILGDILLGDDSGDDLLGALEISGDDLMGDSSDGDDLMGLDLNPLHAFRKKVRRKAAIRKALLQRKLMKGTLLKNMVPRGERLLPLGFFGAAVPANGVITVNAQPQVTFRGQRFSVSSLIAPFFTINQIQVGKDNQFVQAGPTPATSFSELAVGDNMQLDTCAVGQIIALTVQNIDAAAAHDFRATLFGTAILMGPSC